MPKTFIYQEISNRMAAQIKTGTLGPGEKLPSIRNLCRVFSISANTAKNVYFDLESRSLVDAKPQKGFFVSKRASPNLPLTNASSPSPTATKDEPNELINHIYSNMGRKDLTLLSISVPSGNLLPLVKLRKEIVQATHELEEGGAEYEPLQGNVKLRKMVAMRSIEWGGNLNEDDLITTSGGMNALSLCLMAVAMPGDTIAIESPCYPGILQLARSFGLRVLELPTHPVTGIEMAALKAVISEINICLLIPNFNTPLGSCMPLENKKEVVSLLSKHNVPLIEDDVYGDLYFGSSRPKCCKAFDEEGNVLWCSSISKTLAPGYRVGWVAPGRYKEKILKLKLIHSISSTSVIQETVGNFLRNGRYETHLRQLRKTLQINYQNYIDVIAEYFPEGTKTSRPQGGLGLWIEFDDNVDTVKLYEIALKRGISIAPGRMFTLQNQFNNCMRLCIGLPWSNDLRLKLKEIGNLAKLNLT